MLTIHSNGSKWLGEEPDTIEDLLNVLSSWQLDRERFGDALIQPLGNGVVRFFGNFKRLSHAFRIDTDDPEMIGRLTRAIDDNADVQYDPVEKFYLAVVRRARRWNGRWENMIRNGNGYFLNTANGLKATYAKMQELANSGHVEVY